MLKWLVLSGLVIFLLAVGVGVYRDYGVPWDEESQIQVAVANHRYIFKHDPGLLSYKDRYYGPFFELPLLWVTARLPRPESVHIRHLLIYIIFTVGVGMYFLLAQRLLHRTGWALLAALFLVASPRIFADAFYNSKDIPFLAAFIAAVWATLLLTNLLQKETHPLVTAAGLGLHSIVSAALISTRVVGIILPALTGFLLLIAGLQSAQQMKRSLLLLGLDLSLTAGLTILFWPILWHDPLNEFTQALRQMSSFPNGPPKIFYQGQFYNLGGLPWHYLPVWFGITTPLLLLASGGVGWLLGAFQEARGLACAWREHHLLQVMRDPDRLAWLAVSIWMAVPVTAVYVLHSILYDGWRHMFFVYPAWVLFAVGGLKVVTTRLEQIPERFRLGRFNLGHIALAVIVFVGIAEPVGFMVRWHPHQNVYFNGLAGDPAEIRQRFEMDYWGLAYKQAIDYILAHDASEQIPIYLANPPGGLYIDNALPTQQSARLKKTADLAEARYFVTDFRWHPQDYPYPPAWYIIRVRGVEIMAVYRLK